eukprot:g1308.t1
MVFDQKFEGKKMTRILYGVRSHLPECTSSSPTDSIVHSTLGRAANFAERAFLPLSSSSAAKLWHAEQQKCGFAVSPDGNVVALVNGYRICFRFAERDFNGPELHFTIPSETESCSSVFSWHSDSRLFAVSSTIGKVFVFDCYKEQLVCTVCNDVIGRGKLIGLCFRSARVHEEEVPELLLVDMHNILFRFHILRGGTAAKLANSVPKLNLAKYPFLSSVSAVSLSNRTSNCQYLAVCGITPCPTAGEKVQRQFGRVIIWEVLDSPPFYRAMRIFVHHPGSEIASSHPIPKISPFTDSSSFMETFHTLFSRLKLCEGGGVGFSTICSAEFSPSGNKLAVLDVKGALSVWNIEQGTLIHECNGPVREKTKNQTFISIHQMIAAKWWSEDALICARNDGAVIVGSLQDSEDSFCGLKNLLGDEPEMFSPPFAISSAKPTDFRLFVVENTTEEEEHDDEEDKEESTISQNVREIVSQQNPSCRLLSLFRQTPKEVVEAKLASGEYGLALQLCRVYDLNTDLVFKYRWRKRTAQHGREINKHDIKDLLAKVGDIDWALRESWDLVPPFEASTKLLLQYGLALAEKLENDKNEDTNQPTKSMFKKALRRLKTLRMIRTIENQMGLSLSGFTADEFVECRDRDLLNWAIELAENERFKALSVLLKRHPENLLAHRLDILTCIPEFVDPKRYFHLLPVFQKPLNSEEKNSSAEVELEPEPKLTLFRRRKPKKEVQEEVNGTEPFQCFWDHGKGAQLIRAPEDWIDPRDDDEPLFKDDVETVLQWFLSRVYLIEKRTGHLQNALTFCEFGLDHLKTEVFSTKYDELQNVQREIFHLCDLVYVRNVDLDTSLDKWRSLSCTDKVEFLLKESTEDNIVDRIRNRVLPVINDDSSGVKWAKILQQWLINAASKKGGLAMVASVVYESRPSLPHSERLICADRIVDLFAVAVGAVFSSPDNDAWAAIDLIYGSLPSRNAISQREEKENTLLVELQDRVDEMEKILTAGEILAKYGTNYQYCHPPKWFLECKKNDMKIKSFQIRKGAEDVVPQRDGEKLFWKIFVQYARSPVADEEWRELVMDMTALRNRAMQWVSRDFVHRMALQQMLIAGQFDFAYELITQGTDRDQEQENELKEVWVDEDESEEIVLAAAREFFNSSSAIDTPEMDMCLKCLSMCRDGSKESAQVTAERQLVSAARALAKFGVHRMPVEIRSAQRKIDVVRWILEEKNDAYKELDDDFENDLIDDDFDLEEFYDVDEEETNILSSAEGLGQLAGFVMGAYGNYQNQTTKQVGNSLLKFAKLLGITENEYEFIEVKIMIAYKAIDNEDYEDAFNICKTFFNLGKVELSSLREENSSAPNPWEVCLHLAKCNDFENFEMRRDLCTYTIVHAPAEIVVDVISLWRWLETMCAISEMKCHSMKMTSDSASTHVVSKAKNDSTFDLDVRLKSEFTEEVILAAEEQVQYLKAFALSAEDGEPPLEFKNPCHIFFRGCNDSDGFDFLRRSDKDSSVAQRLAFDLQQRLMQANLLSSLDLQEKQALKTLTCSMECNEDKKKIQMRTEKAMSLLLSLSLDMIREDVPVALANMLAVIRSIPQGCRDLPSEVQMIVRAEGQRDDEYFLSKENIDTKDHEDAKAAANCRWHAVKWVIRAGCRAAALETLAEAGLASTEIYRKDLDSLVSACEDEAMSRGWDGDGEYMSNANANDKSLLSGVRKRQASARAMEWWTDAQLWWQRIQTCDEADELESLNPPLDKPRFLTEARYRARKCLALACTSNPEKLRVACRVAPRHGIEAWQVMLRHTRWLFADWDCADTTTIGERGDDSIILEEVHEKERAEKVFEAMKKSGALQILFSRPVAFSRSIRGELVSAVPGHGYGRLILLCNFLIECKERHNSGTIHRDLMDSDVEEDEELLVNIEWMTIHSSLLTKIGKIAPLLDYKLLTLRGKRNFMYDDESWAAVEEKETSDIDCEIDQTLAIELLLKVMTSSNAFALAKCLKKLHSVGVKLSVNDLFVEFCFRSILLAVEADWGGGELNKRRTSTSSMDFLSDDNTEANDDVTIAKCWKRCEEFLQKIDVKGLDVLAHRLAKIYDCDLESRLLIVYGIIKRVESVKSGAEKDLILARLLRLQRFLKACKIIFDAPADASVAKYLISIEAAGPDSPALIGVLQKLVMSGVPSSRGDASISKILQSLKWEAPWEGADVLEIDQYSLITLYDSVTDLVLSDLSDKNDTTSLHNLVRSASNVLEDEDLYGDLSRDPIFDSVVKKLQRFCDQGTNSNADEARESVMTFLNNLGILGAGQAEKLQAALVRRTLNNVFAGEKEICAAATSACGANASKISSCFGMLLNRCEEEIKGATSKRRGDVLVAMAEVLQIWGGDVSVEDPNGKGKRASISRAESLFQSDDMGEDMNDVCYTAAESDKRKTTKIIKPRSRSSAAQLNGICKVEMDRLLLRNSSDMKDCIIENADVLRMCWEKLLFFWATVVVETGCAVARNELLELRAKRPPTFVISEAKNTEIMETLNAAADNGGALAAKWGLFGTNSLQAVKSVLRLSANDADDEICALFLAHSDGLKTLPFAKDDLYKRLVRFALSRERKFLWKVEENAHRIFTESLAWCISSLALHGWTLHAGSLALEMSGTCQEMRTRSAAVHEGIRYLKKCKTNFAENSVQSEILKNAITAFE